MIRTNHSGFLGAKDDTENVFEKIYVLRCIQETLRNFKKN